MIKVIFRYFARVVLVILGFVLTYLMAALILMLVPINADYNPELGDRKVYIISNGVHTDICFRYDSTNYPWKKILHLQQRPTYLSFGWGDKGFYLDTPEWSDLKASTAINAVFLPSETAMHVTLYDKERKASDHVFVRQLSEKNFARLEKFIFQSFEIKDGKSILIPDAKYDGHENYFYEATGSYSMLRSCNQWTNEGLITAGVKTCIWAPFEQSIRYHLAK